MAWRICCSHGTPASNSPLRAGLALWSLAENAGEPGAGVRDRRLHRRRLSVRRADLRVRRGRTTRRNDGRPRRIGVGCHGTVSRRRRLEAGGVGVAGGVDAIAVMAEVRLGRAVAYFIDDERIAT